MRITKRSIVLKVLLGLFAMALLPIFNTKTAKAEEVIELPSTEIEIIDPEEADDIEWDLITAALAERDEITDGESFTVNDTYNIYCEVIFEPVTSSRATLAATTTKSYNATCNVYISTQQKIAVITHNVTITYYDTGLVHINSGSLSTSVSNSFWSGRTYGYQITNTNGSYSSASGTAEFYTWVTGEYVYYNCSVSVTPGSSPSFSFS